MEIIDEVPLHRDYKHQTRDLKVFLQACNGIFNLSEKQMDIVSYMVNNKETKISTEIIEKMAVELNLSVGSVRNYMTDMRKKHAITGKEIAPVFTAPSRISITYYA